MLRRPGPHGAAADPAVSSPAPAPFKADFHRRAARRWVGGPAGGIVVDVALALLWDETLPFIHSVLLQGRLAFQLRPACPSHVPVPRPPVALVSLFHQEGCQRFAPGFFVSVEAIA